MKLNQKNLSHIIKTIYKYHIINYQLYILNLFFHLCPHRLARSRTSPFHGGNRGSNPLGDAPDFIEVINLPYLSHNFLPPYLPPICITLEYHVDLKYSHLKIPQGLWTIDVFANPRDLRCFHFIIPQGLQIIGGDFNPRKHNYPE